MKALRKFVHNTLQKLDYKISKIPTKSNSLSTKLAEGYPTWLSEAQEAGMDVNDYITFKYGAHNDLEKILYPYLINLSNPIICELGIGTGRYSREIAEKLSEHENWSLYLVDHSPWIIDFNERYFKSNKNIFPLLNDGRTLPFQENDFIDIIFSNGTFIELNLREIYSYCREFRRVLKKNGYVMFNFIDINSPEAWEFLEKESKVKHSCFTYHSFETINEILVQSSFEFINRLQVGPSLFVFYRKIENK